MTRGTAAPALVLLSALAAGCGNYSTEDLVFLSALPRRDDLRLAVPAQGAPPPGALVGTAAVSAACPAIGDATIWLEAKPTSDRLNAGVDFVVGLIDAVREYPPTDRSDDRRRWGPFDAENHPGREIRIVIERTWPAGEDGPPAYAYRFEARVKGSPAFTPMIWGTFVGHSASRGSGQVTLDFDAFWALQMNDAGTPHGTMVIDYARDTEPVTIDLLLTQEGFGVQSFGYGFAGYAGGSGAFSYKIRNAAGDVLETWTSYDAAGAGRLKVNFTAAGGATGSFYQCWNAAACLVFVADAYNFTQACGSAPCLAGALAACPTVPAAPF